MLVEQLIFTFISIALFVLIFVKFIKSNDTSYIAVLVLEAIGILINFVEVLLHIKLIILIKIIKYIFALILPLGIIILEKRGIKYLKFKNMAKAKFFLMFQNKKSAKDALIKLVTKYPENYEAHKMLAEIYKEEGGMRKAIDEYVQAIDIDKQDYNSYYNIANLLTQLDKKEEAAEMLNNLLQKKPEYIQASELLGEILLEKEMYKEATNIYLEALKYNPTSYDLNYNLGIAYTMLNDFQSAKTYYEKAAELNSLLYNSKYSLAEIALIYKELDEAEKHFMEVLQEENGELEADTYFELAKINMIKKEKEKAINYANISIEIEPRRMVDKIKNDPIFIPILARLSIPFNLDAIEPKQNKKLSKKELKAKKHLEEMVDITQNLSYNDINLLKHNQKEKEDTYIIEKQNDFQHRDLE